MLAELLPSMHEVLSLIPSTHGRKKRHDRQIRQNVSTFNPYLPGMVNRSWGVLSPPQAEDARATRNQRQFRLSLRHLWLSCSWTRVLLPAGQELGVPIGTSFLFVREVRSSQVDRATKWMLLYPEILSCPFALEVGIRPGEKRVRVYS